MDHIFRAYLKAAEMRAAPIAPAAEAVPVARGTMATSPAPIVKNMGETFGHFIVQFSPTAETAAQVKNKGVKYQSFDRSDLSAFPYQYFQTHRARSLRNGPVFDAG